MKYAAQILSASNLPRKEVVLISDFQRVGWGRHDDVRLPAGTAMTTVDVGGATDEDLAVTQVSTDRDAAGDRDLVTVTARVTNVGTAPRTVEATLDLGGRAVETKKLTIAPKGVAAGPFLADRDSAAGHARHGPHHTDSLAANDEFNLALLAPGVEAVSVLVQCLARFKPRANQSLYVRRALGINDRPAFHIDIRPAADRAARLRLLHAHARLHGARRSAAARRSARSPAA